MQSIGYQVEKIRKLRKITQYDAGQAIKVQQPAYSKRERGETDFSADELQALAELFKVPVESFYQSDISELITVSEPEPVYGRDLSPSGVNGRFIMVARRYMSDHKLKTMVDLADKMKVNIIHLRAVLGGEKNLSMSILCKAVAYCRFNANYITSSAGDYYLKLEDMKGMIAELTANYERALEDKNKLIRVYEALIKEKGIEI